MGKAEEQEQEQEQQQQQQLLLQSQLHTTTISTTNYFYYNYKYYCNYNCNTSTSTTTTSTATTTATATTATTTTIATTTATTTKIPTTPTMPTATPTTTTRTTTSCLLFIVAPLNCSYILRIFCPRPAHAPKWASKSTGLVLRARAQILKQSLTVKKGSKVPKIVFDGYCVSWNMINMRFKKHWYLRCVCALQVKDTGICSAFEARTAALTLKLSFRKHAFCALFLHRVPCRDRKGEKYQTCKLRLFFRRWILTSIGICNFVGTRWPKSLAFAMFFCVLLWENWYLRRFERQHKQHKSHSIARSTKHENWYFQSFQCMIFLQGPMLVLFFAHVDEVGTPQTLFFSKCLFRPSLESTAKATGEWPSGWHGPAKCKGLAPVLADRGRTWTLAHRETEKTIYKPKKDIQNSPPRIAPLTLEPTSLDCL